jgi:hypothetical protein
MTGTLSSQHPRGSRPHPDGVLHILAGAILVLYAASHIGFLMINHPDHGLRNTVFPFFRNWDLFLFAAMAELAVGTFCMRERGRAGTNVVLLTFVAAMLWYRWAFEYTGGRYCGCLGLLGSMLGVSPRFERLVPQVSLVLLVLATLPWMVRTVRSVGRRRMGWTSLFLTLLGCTSAGLTAEEGVEIRGTVTSGRHHPVTGAPYANSQRESDFVVLIQEARWSISITNRAVGSWWERRWFDGTNSYVLIPEGSHFQTSVTNAPSLERARATISASAVSIPVNADPLGASLLQIAYGLKEDRDHELLVGGMPAPWTLVRDHPGNWGYRWQVEYLQPGGLPRVIDVIRDNKLDLGLRQELFRAELDYPANTGEYNAYMRLLKERQAIPTGWVRARYRCITWDTVGGMAIPLSARLETYLPPPEGDLPVRRVALQVTDVQPLRAANPMVVEINRMTQVADYRYKRRGGGRIFNYADYTLEPGDSWKPPDDPILLAQADHWLRHGPKYGRLTRKQNVIAWTMLAIVIFPAVYVFLSIRKRRKVN